MNIRKLKSPSDVDAVKALCEKNGLLFPDIEYCLIAEDDAGNIQGFANIVTVPTVDCFVVDNPYTARKLFDTVVGGALASNQRAIQFYTKREEVIKLYNHLDFTILGNDYTIARKDL